MRGLFISFEGVEGAGKSTQIRLLCQRLIEQGREVCMTREPGGDKVAEGVRALLLSEAMDSRAELLLFLAARAQNVAKVILPAVERGAVVLCDRFIDSSIAYQGYARGLGRDSVENLNRFATNDLTPNITFLLDLPPERGLARQQDRNRMEEESLQFHTRVREGFLAEAKRYPERFTVLDATQSVEALHALIWSQTSARL